MNLKSYRELRVWQSAMELVDRIYAVTDKFPKQEMYGLSSQIQRAAVSVPSNIAEGHTREHRKEFLHHLSMAQSSLAELETQLEIAARRKYISPEVVKKLLEQTSLVGKQLYSLRNALTRPLPTPDPRSPTPSL